MNHPQFNFNNSFAKNLEGFFSYCDAESAIAPKWLQFNRPLAEDLGLDSTALNSEEGLAIFSGNVKAEGSQPLAQAYAGHQFGGFSPQLGDGRALFGAPKETLTPDNLVAHQYLSQSQAAWIEDMYAQSKADHV